ncbi:MAG: alpha-1,2-fucosyltransferase [Spirochaetales bacterium]|nr:alpha-1,2-fucosyltransferase [Spirochaetales bacterium]
MPTVKLFAGLGNQLFQYAYGLWLRSRGEKVRFVLSRSRGSLRDVFEIGDPTILELRNPVALAAVKAWARYVEGAYLVGFHQRREYAKVARESGRFEFRRGVAYARSRWDAAAKEDSSVSVHVRGGDYLTHGAAGVYGSVCGPDYYANAFALIEERIADPKFLVLTDDPEHAARMLEGVGHDYRVVNDGEFEDDPGFDLHILRTCRHHIIANSTFSWWGAFLGSSSGGVTVCPDRWTDDGTVNLDDLVPDDWIRAPAGAVSALLQ